MSAIIFFIAGIGAIAGAVGVVTLRDPFYAVLSLVGHLLCLALLFLLLEAQFVAAAQVVVYAGAVMVLYVFVVAYVGDDAATLSTASGRRAGRRLGAVFGVVLLVELFIALLGSGLTAVSTRGATLHPQFGTPRYIGNLLLTNFLIAFEVASLLLLIAAVGAVVLARRRGGIESAQAGDTYVDVPRPRGTGTMAEAVSSLAFAAAHDRGGDEDPS